MSEKKIFVLDTNILLTSPNVLFGFDDNIVCITMTVLHELFNKRTQSGEIGYNARTVLRNLEKIRTSGNGHKSADFYTGIPINDDRGSFIVYPQGKDKNLISDNFSLDNPDNQILNSILNLKNMRSEQVILVTNDVPMKFDANLNDIEVQGYKNESILSEELYTGRSIVEIEDYKIIETIYKDKIIPVSIIPTDEKFVENEFVTLTCGTESALCMYKNGSLNLIKEHKECELEISGRNAAQKFLLEALMAPAEEIPLVIATGPAGTGKTFLSLAAGLAQVYTSFGNTRKNQALYNQIMITRSNCLADADLGALPGELEEKMAPLLAPFYDNLINLFAGKENDITAAKDQMEYLLSEEIIEPVSLAYIRGRSPQRTLLIVDECQNLTAIQALSIVSRAGFGTKIVLLGDPEQIDNPKLSKKNNGLVFAAEHMKGSKLTAQITFTKDESVRSPLAEEAIKLMSI